MLGIRDPSIEVDHKDGNGLDCRRHNVRPATKQQNQANRGPRANNASGFKGVSWFPRQRRWYARIGVDGRNLYLGVYESAAAAARAYDAAARTHFGEFAKLNFPEDAGAPPTRATLRFPGAKLSFAQVAEIQGRRASGERAAALAMEYGVAKSTVNRLVCGCSWAGAPGGGFPIVRGGAAAEDAAVAGLALSGGSR